MINSQSIFIRKIMSGKLLDYDGLQHLVEKFQDSTIQKVYQLPAASQQYEDVTTFLTQAQQGYIKNIFYTCGFNEDLNIWEWEPVQLADTQVQADWQENDESDPSYIEHRTHYVSLEREIVSDNFGLTPQQQYPVQTLSWDNHPWSDISQWESHVIINGVDLALSDKFSVVIGSYSFSVENTLGDIILSVSLQISGDPVS